MFIMSPFCRKDHHLSETHTLYACHEEAIGKKMIGSKPATAENQVFRGTCTH